LIALAFCQARALDRALGLLERMMDRKGA